MPRTSESSLQEKPAIVLHEVTKSFRLKHTKSLKETFISAVRRRETSSEFHAVEKVSFSVAPGESVALLGKNGSGKSTTLKMVSGVMHPDDGWVRTRGRVAGLLEVGAGFHPDLTGRQNVYLNAAILGMSKEETDKRFDDILEFSEIGDFIDTEVKRYSSGMYSRLGFSVAVHTELDILLVDEVLSVGDAQFREKCNRKMLDLTAQGKTLFVVSHSAAQVKRLCNRGIVLDSGRVIFDGSIGDALAILNEPVTNRTPFTVTGHIREYYETRVAQYGPPLGPETAVDGEDGGIFQEFEKGIINTFRDRSGELQTLGLTRGIFLTAYKKRGGPPGPWGFIAGSPEGDLIADEPRSMPFSRGIAQYTIDDGMSFRPEDE